MSGKGFDETKVKMTGLFERVSSKGTRYFVG